MQYVQSFLSDIFEAISKYIPFMILGGLAFVIICTYALCNIFKKAGLEEWKAIIPIYNLHYLWKISRHYFEKVFFSIAITVILSLIVLIIAKRLDNMLFALPIAFFIGVWGVWLLIENAKVAKGLSINFGHGTLFAIGLYLLSPIFLLILGYGKSEYIGKVLK